MTKIVNFLSYNLHLFHGSVIADFGKLGSLLSLSDDPPLVYQDALRQNEIVHRVVSADPLFDVISFTEVWGHKIADQIAAALPVTYQYDRYRGESNAEGSCGMQFCVLGQKTRPFGFYRYSGLVESDSYSAKGVAVCQTQIKGREVLLLQTHTQASYIGKEAVCERARRQSLENTLFPLIDDSLRSRIPIFLLGDLNIVGGSAEYDWFSEQMAKRGLQDAWTALRDSDPGYTYCPDDNPLVQKFDPKETKSQRLDYIFYQPTLCSAKSATVPTDWKTPEGTDGSDHYPLLVTFQV